MISYQRELTKLLVWFVMTDIAIVAVDAFQSPGANISLRKELSSSWTSSSSLPPSSNVARILPLPSKLEKDHEPYQHQRQKQEVRRRSILKSMFLTGTTTTTAMTLTLTSATASASAATTRAKGAAEYDFEYYMRDLLKGNKKEGVITPSKPPPTPPPRSMAPASFIRSIIDEGCTGNCIAVDQLSRLLSKVESSETAIEMTAVTTDMISKKVTSFRDKVQNVFYVKEPWTKESILDEYYFDLTCYALYRTAAELIPTDYRLRDLWVRNIGREIYQLLQREGMVQVPPPPLTAVATKGLQLTDTIPALIQIMDSFQNSNLIRGYRLGEKNDDVRTGKNIFDEYDNEDINSNTSVNLLVSVFRPATLGSSLQITGEGSRFSTDLISPTLAALFEDQLGLKVEYEGYFVDEEYRPNPKDFFPDEQLLQFTLKRK